MERVQSLVHRWYDQAIRYHSGHPGSSLQQVRALRADSAQVINTDPSLQQEAKKYIDFLARISGISQFIQFQLMAPESVTSHKTKHEPNLLEALWQPNMQKSSTMPV